MENFDFAKFFYVFFALVSIVCAFIGIIASMAMLSFVPFLLLIPGILFLSVTAGLGMY